LRTQLKLEAEVL